MPQKKGKMRKIEVLSDTGDQDHQMQDEAATEKKQRKKWTPEETQMLVKGCNIVSISLSL